MKKTKQKGTREWFLWEKDVETNVKERTFYIEKILEQKKQRKRMNKWIRYSDKKKNTEESKAD